MYRYAFGVGTSGVIPEGHSVCRGHKLRTILCARRTLTDLQIQHSIFLGILGSDPANGKDLSSILGAAVVKVVKRGIREVALAEGKKEVLTPTLEQSSGNSNVWAPSPDKYPQFACRRPGFRKAIVFGLYRSN